MSFYRVKDCPPAVHEARAVVPDVVCAWRPLGSSEKRLMPGGATRDVDSVGEGLRCQPAGVRTPGPEH